MTDKLRKLILNYNIVVVYPNELNA